MPKLLPGERYARDVASGKQVACRWVRLACQRHLDDLKRWGTKPGKGPFWFDAEAAQYALDFFPLLKLKEGEFSSRPFGLAPFQEFIIACLFGWMGADGARRFRTGYVEIGKGNGKSPLAAGIGLFGLVADGEDGAQIYAAAKDKDQAKISWNDAAAMRDSSPQLAARVEKHVNNLSVPETGSFFRPLSSDQSKASGQRVHMAIIDELHEHPSSETVDKVRAGVKGRRQPLIFEITNSGHDRTSICWRHHELSLKVLQGLIKKDDWFAFVCGLDEGDDWRNPAVWVKANPGLGAIIPERYLRDQVEEAIADPAKQNIVRRLNFCEWTETTEAWMAPDTWAACKDEAGCAWEGLAGRPCYAGLDLASTTDLATHVELFLPTDADPLWRVKAKFFLPEENLRARCERDFVPYDQWAREGWIILTPGDVIDDEWIKADLLKTRETYGLDVRHVDHDRWGAQRLVAALTSDGFLCVPIPQTCAGMSGGMKHLMTLALSKKIAHDGNPVLAWCMSNVVAWYDTNDNIRPVKSSGRAKIDGAVALIMALGQAIIRPEEKPFASVYEQRTALFC